ncbi:dihydroorotase [Nisaea sp.]|uniref:dihydroorotase n=1 Tax=Nisaea sp. TaxID=2024842 RepID=UPI0032EEC92C
MSRTLFKNARLLDPESGLDAQGALLVDGSRVLDIGPNVFIDAVQQDVRVVDCKGLCLAPGLVDMRVSTGEPGNEHMETLATAAQAAVAGGVTTFTCLPNTDPIVDDVAVLEFVERLGRDVGLVNIHSYAAATKGLGGKVMTELGLLHESGAAGFTDGGKAIAHPLVMRRLLSYAQLFDTVIVQHPEMPEMVGSGVMNEGETAMRLGLSGIPAAAEVMMIERDLRLVELTGGRLHFSCLSTGAAVDAVRRAKASGLRVTADTAPPYFALNESAVVGYRTFAKLSPPLRTEEDRCAVIEGIADGTIDAIVSAHTPGDRDQKRLPFTQADFGGVGLETLLAVSLELVHNNQVPLLTVLKALTQTPADLLKFPAGRLRRGHLADFILFDPDRAVRIDRDELRGKSRNTPFDERPVQGRVERTYRAGNLVFDIETSPVPERRRFPDA